MMEQSVNGLVKVEKGIRGGGGAQLMVEGGFVKVLVSVVEEEGKCGVFLLSLCLHQ